MITETTKQQLRENYDAYQKEYGDMTYREYVETNAENDPGFFHFLFNQSLDNNFDRDLTDEQRAEYDEFLNGLPCSLKNVNEILSEIRSEMDGFQRYEKEFIDFHLVIEFDDTDSNMILTADENTVYFTVDSDAGIFPEILSQSGHEFGRESISFFNECGVYDDAAEEFATAYLTQELFAGIKQIMHEWDDRVVASYEELNEDIED